jgi:NitT/TauT family transport system substrate-binding protein
MRFSLGLFIAIAVCVVSSLAVGRAVAQTPVTMRVAAFPAQDVGPLLYAMKAGLFTKAGLDIQFTELTTGSAVSSAVAGGSADVGFSSLPALIAGHERGIPFQLVAPGLESQPNAPALYLMVRKDSPIRSGVDLNGKTAASPALRDADWMMTSAWIDENGGDSKSVRFVELPFPALFEGLVSGRIDAYAAGEPWVTRALDSGKVRILSDSARILAPRVLITAWFSTTAYATGNRDALERFERVMRDANGYVNTHKADVISLVADFTKLDPALVARTLKGANAIYIDPATIQPLIDAGAKYHSIEKRFNAADLISPVALKPNPSRP